MTIIHEIILPVPDSLPTVQMYATSAGITMIDKHAQHIHEILDTPLSLKNNNFAKQQEKIKPITTYIND